MTSLEGQKQRISNRNPVYIEERVKKISHDSLRRQGKKVLVISVKILIYKLIKILVISRKKLTEDRCWKITLLQNISWNQIDILMNEDE